MRSALRGFLAHGNGKHGVRAFEAGPEGSQGEGLHHFGGVPAGAFLATAAQPASFSRTSSCNRSCCCCCSGRDESDWRCSHTAAAFPAPSAFGAGAAAAATVRPSKPINVGLCRLAKQSVAFKCTRQLSSCFCTRSWHWFPEEVLCWYIQNPRGSAIFR